MNISVKSVYQDKAAVGKLEDFEGLIDILHKHIPGIAAVDNHDRTISVHCDDNYPVYQPLFEKSISKWVKHSKVELNCHPMHVFNVLPLSPQNVLIKI